MQVIKLRLRDKHRSELVRQARATNYVWNFCNETQQKAVKSDRKWLSNYDLQSLTAGSSKLLGLHAHTIQQVCTVYSRSRQAQKKAWLKWRSSKRSLGWVPFNTGHVQKTTTGYKFRGAVYEVMHDRTIPDGTAIKAGSFNEDSRGRWYINLTVDLPPVPSVDPDKCVGIDLGLKDLAALSDGSVIENIRPFMSLSESLAKAQRAGKKMQTRAIHAKIKNARKDHMDKASAAIAKTYGTIVVGDVSSSKLTRTKMAKSVNDAGWSSFKHMLRYKAIRHGGIMIEASEYMSTRGCSECGALSGPQGQKDLGIRGWKCTDCGAEHQRDVNAATNILRVGLDTLAEGASK